MSVIRVTTVAANNSRLATLALPAFACAWLAAAAGAAEKIPVISKRSYAAGNDTCQGKLDVTAASVSGHYVCKGVTSYDPRSGQMGTVNIEISLTPTT
jgi:hypothetical protein